MVSLFSEDGPFMLHWQHFNMLYRSLRANYNLYLSSFVSHFFHFKLQLDDLFWPQPFIK